MDTKTVGAVVGRFQIDDLHDGHRTLLDHVIARHKRVVVLVGVRPANPDSRNPLSFEVRRNMIQKAYPTVLILPIQDEKHDEFWSENVDKMLRIAVGNYPVIFYTGRDGFGPHYHGRHEVKEIANLEVVVPDLDKGFSATDRRESIRYSATELDSPDFRAGIIHGVMNRFPVIETTVDVAILRDGDDGIEIVLGRKRGQNQWRLPGGFSEVRDGMAERLEVTCSREASEEANLSIDQSAWEYAGNFDVPDWRVRDADDHFIRTFLFVSHGAHFGALKGGDDLPEVEWVPIKTVARNWMPSHKIVDGHLPLLNRVLDILKNKPTETEQRDEA